jgi:archaetidylinositol phosphate synthase
MIDSKFRRPLQPIFDTMGKALVKMHFTPDKITWMAFLIGVLSAFFVALDKTWMAIALLWISGLMDILDGTVARISRKSSLSGAYMDLILDRMVEAGMILGFVFLLPLNHIAYIVFFIAVIFNFSTFVVAGALFKNTGMKSMHYDFGLAERTETFIVFSLMMIFQEKVFVILMTFNLIIFITGFVRFVKVLKHSREEENHQ